MERAIDTAFRDNEARRFKNYYFYMQKKKYVREYKTNNNIDNDKHFSLKFQRVSCQRACVCVDSHKHTRTHAY